MREQRANNEYIKQIRSQHSQQYFRRITKFNSRQMRSLVVKETSDVKPSKSVETHSESAIKESELIKLIKKLSETPAHRFIVMRFKKWKRPIEKDCCLEYCESLLSQATNLSIIDWLSKKNI